MVAHWLETRLPVLIATVFAASCLTACGGVDVPLHDGYRSKKSKPWKKPKMLEFDEDFEAEKDGELSYLKRRRASWFAVDLPADGEVEVRIDVSPLGLAAEAAEFEDDEDPFDVAFEVYDENFRLLERADRDADDAGDRQRSRTVAKLLKGRYLIHIFLQRRLDEAEFNLRVKYNRAAVELETDFPVQVAFVEPLPVVPIVDDAPEGKKRCRGKKCGKKRPRNGKKPDKGSKNDNGGAQDVPAGAISAKIIGVRQASNGGTHITINVGSGRQVERGWKGQVVTSKGKAIPGGRFKIKKVQARTSTATVEASPDSVSGARRVRISPP